MELTHNGDDLANSSHGERRTTASDNDHLAQDNDGGNDGDSAVDNDVIICTVTLLILVNLCVTYNLHQDKINI